MTLYSKYILVDFMPLEDELCASLSNDNCGNAVKYK